MDRERKREMDRRTGLGTEGQRVRERGTGRGIGRGGQWTDWGQGQTDWKRECDKGMEKLTGTALHRQRQGARDSDRNSDKD